MQVAMQLSRIFIREMTDMQIIELSEVGGERTFPIVIGLPEAFAIERRLKGIEIPRPQTHDQRIRHHGGEVGAQTAPGQPGESGREHELRRQETAVTQESARIAGVALCGQHRGGRCRNGGREHPRPDARLHRPERDRDDNHHGGNGGKNESLRSGGVSRRPGGPRERDTDQCEHPRDGSRCLAHCQYLPEETRTHRVGRK